MKVKVCGVTSPEDARAVAAAGADAVGLMFWPSSPRAVDVETACRIAAALPPFVLRVGVFVNAELAQIERVADAVGLDLLQLHGQEPPEIFDDLPRRAIKALHVKTDADVACALRYAERGVGVLVDAGTGLQPGGTGQPCDWRLARRVREQVEFLILAGGLRAENVSDAIAAVEPHAVDVSSGVESAPGRKDARRVKAFVDAVRSTGR